MLKKYYSVFGPALRVLDAVILVSCWMVAYYLRKHYPLSIMQTKLPPFYQYWPYAILIVLLWGTVFSISNLYSNKRIIRRTIEAYRVGRAHILSLLIFISLTYFVSAYKISRGVFLYFGCMSGFLLVFCRILLRNALRRFRAQGNNLQRVLIVGTGHAAAQAYRKLARHPELGLDIIGFVGTSVAQDGTPNHSFEGLPLLAGISGLEKILQQHQPQKLVIALSRTEVTQLEPILNELKDAILDIILVPDIYDYVALGCEVEDFDGLPMVTLNETPIVGFNMFLKRICDIVLSTLAIMIFSPVILLLILVVKLTSRGPVFYTQERMSINGKKFAMLKFRSMEVDHAGDVKIHTQKDDPRVTWIGSFMRKTSLDELPQFVNVLMGDMSIVGPRPERTWVVEEVRNQVPRYMLKHKVKAGITGWAQVNGWRGDTSLEKRIEYDLYYIKHWSLLFDIKILVLTIVRGFINKNAY